MKKHEHKWFNTKKTITRSGWLNRLLGFTYEANIAKCRKCKDWRYITIEN
jgi:hypothetical protein